MTLAYSRIGTAPHRKIWWISALGFVAAAAFVAGMLVGYSWALDKTIDSITTNRAHYRGPATMGS